MLLFVADSINSDQWQIQGGHPLLWGILDPPLQTFNLLNSNEHSDTSGDAMLKHILGDTQFIIDYDGPKLSGVYSGGSRGRPSPTSQNFLNFI